MFSYVICYVNVFMNVLYFMPLYVNATHLLII